MPQEFTEAEKATLSLTAEDLTQLRRCTIEDDKAMQPFVTNFFGLSKYLATPIFNQIKEQERRLQEEHQKGN